MGNRKKPDPFISEIEHALNFGEFITYDRSWDFVQTLENEKHKVDNLVRDGQAERAVSLYEIFLAGCYEKVNEIDDSGGNLGMFFQDLFCSWIKAREKAKYNPAETVQNILGCAFLIVEKAGITDMLCNIFRKPGNIIKKAAGITFG